jgi:hypothetical protein
MGITDDPGYDKVTDETRRFEEKDEQVFPGAGRGPTRAEAAAAERAAPVSDHTREAYREMLWRGAHLAGRRPHLSRPRPGPLTLGRTC